VSRDSLVLVSRGSLVLVSRDVLHPFDDILKRRFFLVVFFLVYFPDLLAEVRQLVVLDPAGRIFYFKQLVLLEGRMFQVLKLFVQVFFLFEAHLHHLAFNVAVEGLILPHRLLVERGRVLLQRC
jgi:hypothetical protein